MSAGGRASKGIETDAASLLRAVVAIYCGHRARSELRQRGAAETGDGLAVTGLALGYANVVGTIIGCVIAAVVFGGFFAALGAAGLVAEGTR